MADLRSEDKVAQDLLEKLQECWSMSENLSKQLEEDAKKCEKSRCRDQLDLMKKSIAELRIVHGAIMKPVKDISVTSKTK